MEIPAGPQFQVPEPPPPPPAAEPPPPAPPPWTPGGWNDPRGLAGRDGPTGLRWGPILVFGALFLALGGVLVWLFLVPSAPPRPAVAAVTIWKYNDPALPPNPWAKKDGERLVACFPEDTARPDAPAGQEELIQTATDLKAFVAKLAKQKPDRPYVCYLNAIAAQTPAGVAVLSPVAGAESDVTIAPLPDGMKAWP